MVVVRTDLADTVMVPNVMEISLGQWDVAQAGDQHRDPEKPDADLKGRPQVHAPASLEKKPAKNLSLIIMDGSRWKVKSRDRTGSRVRCS